jgi:chromosome partitioning protein
MTPPEDLIGIFEIAEMSGVTRAAVANWRNRFRDFPKPAAELRSGPVFHRAQVRRWLGKRRGGVARVVALTNLKRGVGTTTTAVALAEILAGDLRRRVLVIDLDSQCDASLQLLGAERWRKIYDKGRTVARLIEDAVGDSGRKPIKPESLLVRGASPVADARTLDLLPSTMDLGDVLRRWERTPAGPDYRVDPTAVLAGALAGVIDEYDDVIIDLPPDLGLLTLNGLRIATGYLVPVSPDEMAAFGVGSIARGVAAFSAEIGETIRPLGLLQVRVGAEDPLPSKRRRRWRKDPIAWLETVVPEHPEPIPGRRREPFETCQARYGDGDLYQAYLNLAEELRTALEPTSKQDEEPPPETTEDHDESDEVPEPGDD